MKRLYSLLNSLEKLVNEFRNKEQKELVGILMNPEDIKILQDEVSEICPSMSYKDGESSYYAGAPVYGSEQIQVGRIILF